MKKTPASFLSRVLMLGVAVSALQVSAHAQNLSLNATPSVATLTPRGTATITLTVQNSGATDAAAVVVSVAVSKGLRVTLPANCSSGHGGITCQLNTVAAGASENFTIELNSLKTGDFSASFSADCSSACGANTVTVPLYFR